MFARLRSRYGRLNERVLWFTCCAACFVCFVFVFLSLYYLEDHRERLACRKSGKDRTAGSYRTLFNSYPAEMLGSEHPGNVQDSLAKNLELKRTVQRLTNFGAKTPVERSSNSLEERRLERTQDIQTVNDLQRTIKERRVTINDKFAGLRLWQERSLKYITTDARHPEETRKKYSDVLGCREISQIIVTEELGRGYTKLTQRGVYRGREVAVKSVGLDSKDLHKCVEEKRAKLASDCLLFSRYKVMKELLLYQQLYHPNVIKLLGYCFQNDQDTADIQSRGLTVVTELGTPLNLMSVLQMAWHQRFRIALGFARLMKYFSDSPLGSLVIRDFQLIQFVIINGDVMISDLDDVGNEEHACRSILDCGIGNDTHNITHLPCVSDVCEGYNEKWNLYNLERFYFKMFLLPGAPAHVAADLQKIQDSAALLQYNSEDLVQDLERVLGTLRNGQGLETEKYTSRYQYKVIPRADFPGRHDYDCDHSISFVNCQGMVFDEDEAMRQCDADEVCKAFVMSYDKTWIGYKWVYFKNNSTNMVFSAKNRVYIKIT